MMNILICDDSKEDLESVSTIVEDFYGNTLEGTITTSYSFLKFSDPLAALAYIKDGNKIDLAILDIMMPQMSGIELAQRMREIGFEGYLIFLSTTNDFAAQSYSVSAFSYILKPAESKKVCELLKTIEKTRYSTDRKGFSITRKSGVRFVLYLELMYVEVINHQLHFHLNDGEIIKIYATLREYSAILLEQRQMVKPQKSFIINLDYVRSCEKRAIYMRDGTRISVPKDFEIIKEQWLEQMFGGEGW